MDDTKVNEEEVSWKDVISKVDFVFFWLILIITALVTATMLWILATK